MLVQAARAGARRRRENFRSDAWRASACSARLRPACSQTGGSVRAISSSAGGCMVSARRHRRELPARRRAGPRGRIAYGITATFISPLRCFMCCEHRGQLAQRNFGVDEVAGADFAARDGVERLADEARRVVERGLDGDLGIVQRRGVELHLRAPRAAAEQIDRAAAAHHLQGPLPGHRRADGFDHRIGAAAAFGQAANRGDRIAKACVTSKAARAPMRSAARI